MSNESQTETSAPATAPVPARPLVQTTSDNQGMNAYSSSANFEAGIRMAKSLMGANMAPAQYQGNLSNCLLAMEMASRIGVSVFAVMQNLDIIHGRPGWRGKFLIATLNACGKFSALRFRWEEDGETTNPLRVLKRSDSFGCRAVAKDLKTGEELVGPLVSWEMVKAEGWNSKNGSKWRTPLAELMFMYRAGSYFVAVYAPEMSLGMGTSEEVIDTVGYEVRDEKALPAHVAQGSLRALEAELLGNAAPTPPKSEPAPVSHDENGVVKDGRDAPGEEG